MVEQKREPDSRTEVAMLRGRCEDPEIGPLPATLQCQTAATTAGAKQTEIETARSTWSRVVAGMNRPDEIPKMKFEIREVANGFHVLYNGAFFSFAPTRAMAEAFVNPKPMACVDIWALPTE